MNVQSDIVPVAVGKRRTSVPLSIAPQPHGSFLTLEFWLRPALVRAELVSPDGRSMDLTGLLRRMPAPQTRRPQWGDFYVLTDIVRDPEPGRWHLVLDHEPASALHEVRWQAVQQPRYSARLSTLMAQAPRSGIETAIVLEVSDYGIPSDDVRPGALLVTGPDGSMAEHTLRRSDAPGRYVARIPLPSPGVVGLEAQPVWHDGSAGQASVRATLELEVEPGDTTALPALSVVPSRRAGGCIDGLTFTLDWTAEQSGTHVLSVAFGSGPRATGSVEVQAPGPVRLQAFLRGSRLSDLANGLTMDIGPIRQASVVEIVHAEGGIRLLRRQSGVPLSAAFDPADLCR